MNEIMNINGVDCYEKDGVAYLKLENVARGLGFTQTQTKNGKEYISIRWETIQRYLDDIGFPNKLGKNDFIPENIFYRLAMKAKNETAEKFQTLVADEIIPSIRRTGSYSVNNKLPQTYLEALKELVAKVEENERLALENKQKDVVIEEKQGLIEKQNERLQTQRPFVQFALKIQNTNNSVDMKTAAKMLVDDGIEIGRNKLFKILRKHDVLMDDNTPYQKYVDLKLFSVTMKITSTHYGDKMNPVTLVTGKGLIFLNKKLREWLGIDEMMNPTELEIIGE